MIMEPLPCEVTGKATKRRLAMMLATRMIPAMLRISQRCQVEYLPLGWLSLRETLVVLLVPKNCSALRRGESVTEPW